MKTEIIWSETLQRIKNDIHDWNTLKQLLIVAKACVSCFPTINTIWAYLHITGSMCIIISKKVHLNWCPALVVYCYLRIYRYRKLKARQAWFGIFCNMYVRRCKISCQIHFPSSNIPTTRKNRIWYASEKSYFDEWEFKNVQATEIMSSEHVSILLSFLFSIYFF